MIRVRRATALDTTGMGLAHVAAWRSAYAGILPDTYLSGLSALREAGSYQRGIAAQQNEHVGFVAVATAEDLPEGSRMPPGGLVVGFCTGGLCRRPALADGEIETLYVLDDWREQGLGRKLMGAMASHLHGLHCRTALVWVLAENPSRWFYERLGGKLVAHEAVRVAGQDVTQQAMRWDKVESLLAATAGSESGG